MILLLKMTKVAGMFSSSSKELVFMLQLFVKRVAAETMFNILFLLLLLERGLSVASYGGFWSHELPAFFSYIVTCKASMEWH